MILLFLALFHVGSAPAQTTVVDRVAAIVNSEIISESDVRSFKKKLDQNKMVDELLLFGDSSDTLKKEKKAQLNYLIREKILESEIKRLNLSVTMERVDQEMREIAKRNGMAKADLLVAVRSQGMDSAEYQNFVKNRIERQSLIENEISSKIRVSDDDIAGQFQRQYPNDTLGIYEYQLSHIFFNPKKGGPQKATERAQSVLKKIRAGESFEILAEQNSEDSNFVQGGALGSFKTGELPPAMESAVRELSVGEVSDVAPGRSGLHILKVVAKKLIPAPKFEKEKEKIRAALYEKAFQKHFRNWLEAKREEAFIRINL